MITDAFFFICWGTGTRTPIRWTKTRCPTFRRSPNVALEYHFGPSKSIWIDAHASFIGYLASAQRPMPKPHFLIYNCIMNNNTILTAIAVIILVGAGAYVLTRPKPIMESYIPPSVQGSAAPQAGAQPKSSIVWKFADAGERDGIPYTKVTVAINNKPYEAGQFAGSCNEIGANGSTGIDGKGLLPGELSAAQCWYAGGGDEVGVFANENGGFDIMTGQLGEGEEGAGMFRGDFKVKQAVQI